MGLHFICKVHLWCSCYDKKRYKRLDMQICKARGEARKASDAKLGMHELVPPCCEK